MKVERNTTIVTLIVLFICAISGLLLGRGQLWFNESVFNILLKVVISIDILMWIIISWLLIRIDLNE